LIMLKPTNTSVKTVVTIRIDNDIWTNFRKRCIDKDVKYSHELEKILSIYLRRKKNEPQGE
jgi:hypothetical protein